MGAEGFEPGVDEGHWSSVLPVCTAVRLHYIASPVSAQVFLLQFPMSLV